MKRREKKREREKANKYCNCPERPFLGNKFIITLTVRVLKSGVLAKVHVA